MRESLGRHRTRCRGFDRMVSQRAELQDQELQRGCERSRPPPDGPAWGNVITDQQTWVRRAEIRVYTLLLSLPPCRMVLKELNNIQPNLQPSLDVALLWLFRHRSTWPGAVWSITGWIQPSLEVLFTTLGGFSIP